MSGIRKSFRQRIHLLPDPQNPNMRHKVILNQPSLALLLIELLSGQHTVAPSPVSWLFSKQVFLKLTQLYY